MTQVHHILKEIAEDATELKLNTTGQNVNPDAPCALLGDLNALCKSDYSSEHWAGLEKLNAARGWNPPVDDK